MKREYSRPLIFGEVLFDHFPDGSVVLGGAPFNVAWHLQAFGLSPLLVSKVGDDPLGRQIRVEMLSWGMDTAGLGMDSAHPTGTVEVALIDGEPTYDICENRAYDFIDFDALPTIPKGGVLYHGTLALRNEASRRALAHIKQTQSAHAFVDINLRSPWWDHDAVQKVLEDASWLKLNEAELMQIVPEEVDLACCIEHLLSHSSIQLLVITQGARGARAITAQGEQFSVSPNQMVTLVDAVGAGDAFSSVLLLGQAHEWPLPVTLERAQEFASAVVAIRGATTKQMDFYKSFIDAWELKNNV